MNLVRTLTERKERNRKQVLTEDLPTLQESLRRMEAASGPTSSAAPAIRPRQSLAQSMPISRIKPTGPPPEPPQLISKMEQPDEEMSLKKPIPPPKPPKLTEKFRTMRDADVEISIAVKTSTAPLAMKVFIANESIAISTGDRGAESGIPWVPNFEQMVSEKPDIKKAMSIIKNSLEIIEAQTSEIVLKLEEQAKDSEEAKLNKN